MTTNNERTLQAAAVIKHPIAKAMGSVNLMIYIIISKYADGLSLYRLEKLLSVTTVMYQEPPWLTG
jgi:uncharacterized membrane protein